MRVWWYNLGLSSMRDDLQRTADAMPEDLCKKIDYRKLAKRALDDESWRVDFGSDENEGCIVIGEEVGEYSTAGSNEDATAGVCTESNPCRPALDVPLGSPDRPAYNPGDPPTDFPVDEAWPCPSSPSSQEDPSSPFLSP